MVDPRPDEERDTVDHDPGVTRVLTDEGWEDSIYIEPADDWELGSDGAWSSPDGRMRSWPAAGPEPVAPSD